MSNPFDTIRPTAQVTIPSLTKIAPDRIALFRSIQRLDEERRALMQVAAEWSAQYQTRLIEAANIGEYISIEEEEEHMRHVAAAVTAAEQLEITIQELEAIRAEG